MWYIVCVFNQTLFIKRRKYLGVEYFRACAGKGFQNKAVLYTFYN